MVVSKTKRTQFCVNSVKQPISLPSVTSEDNDYDEQYPPLNGSKNKTGSRTSEVHLDSTNLSSPCKSSPFHSWTSGEDALSLQKKGPMRRHALRSIEEAAYGTTFEHKGNGSRTTSMVDLDPTNPSTPSQIFKFRKDRNHSISGCKNRDQSRKRRQVSPFDICSSVLDTSIDDWGLEDEANGETVEVSNKHRVLRPGMVLLKDFLTHHVQVKL